MVRKLISKIQDPVLTFMARTLFSPRSFLYSILNILFKCGKISGVLREQATQEFPGNKVMGKTKNQKASKRCQVNQTTIRPGSSDVTDVHRCRQMCTGIVRMGLKTVRVDIFGPFSYFQTHLEKEKYIIYFHCFLFQNSIFAEQHIRKSQFAILQLLLVVIIT